MRSPYRTNELTQTRSYWMWCVFASLTGISSFDSVEHPENDVAEVKETLDQTKVRLLTQEQKLVYLEDRFFERLDGAEARINAEIRGQQKQLDDLRGLIHIVLSFLVGLSGYLIYEKRSEKKE
ncbi:hypothetical protein K5X82_15435 [Halosquirtibacter xylanolyticus]|uniref:hypothetical protein n=1 Tax=Halosquirtibacter xylanolyticus TaxID=3374599 RepID=UPI00374800E1|nr:hypothetical protein K5X82_15435 [Prolixibacteraceae bacterium]